MRVSELIWSPWFWIAITCLYMISHGIYNCYFHPLAKFPGPKTWALTRLVWVRALASGEHQLHIKALHDKYGPVVRVAPNELSYTGGTAWRDIYTKHNRNKGLDKNMILFGAQDFHSWFDGNNEEHTKLRRKLSYAFSDQAEALGRQERILDEYVGKMVSNLHVAAKSRQVIDIMEWINWLTFDVTGELAFSESFGQLDKVASNPWISMITSHIKYSAYNICIRFFSPLDRLLPLITPASLHKMKLDFCSMAQQKVYQRLNRADSEKLEDIMAGCLPHRNGGKEYMDTESLIGSFTFFIIAGSETTATTLTGIVNLLCQNPRVMKQLVEEIRSFEKASDLTMAATTKLPYLNAVMKEGLRQCHPIPGSLSRVVPPEGAVICDQFVPGNTYVGIPHYAAYHSALNFDQPDSFYPERWLGKEEHKLNEGESIFQPFAMGGHNCVGQNLARNEMRMVLAHFLYHFDVEVVEGTEWHKQECYMLWQKSPFMVRVNSARQEEQ